MNSLNKEFNIPKSWQIPLAVAAVLIIVGTFLVISKYTVNQGNNESNNQVTNPVQNTSKSSEQYLKTETLSVSQKNAIRSAESYLAFSHFSRNRLIKQLEYEGYSNADATNAVDSVVVDWSEQAAESAKSYLEISPYSRSGLIAQLIYEGFTREQAEFGVNSVGL